MPGHNFTYYAEEVIGTFRQHALAMAPKAQPFATSCLPISHYIPYYCLGAALRLPHPLVMRAPVAAGHLDPAVLHLNFGPSKMADSKVRRHILPRLRQRGHRGPGPASPFRSGDCGSFAPTGPLSPWEMT